MSELVRIITAKDDATRNRPLDAFCRAASTRTLVEECAALDRFRRRSDNLYEKVRADFFLYAIHRYHLPFRAEAIARGTVPFSTAEHILKRRFARAIDELLPSVEEAPNAAISSALAAAYRGLAFQTLANQVRLSVRSFRGNNWLSRVGDSNDYPLRIRRELLAAGETGLMPILRESTPVRMDVSHSGWSDIFFLGMDFPEGARVLNISVDLAVSGRGAQPRPPVEASLRVIDEPVLRLVSIDLEAAADIADLDEIFDLGRDYLGLLKAAVIASGMIPPALEGCGAKLGNILARLTGRIGHGVEVVSHVNDIPKGSRLAVSTNLLACLISACMRATSQIRSLAGALTEDERRIVAARAILGEWLGGSGGGWQDSGGLWPSAKLICGVEAHAGDPEYGISRGCLMPRHHVLDKQEFGERSRAALESSLVLVHGGMAQDVGPILEMVTDKYLLRSENEWQARLAAMDIFDQLRMALERGDMAGVGALTERNFCGPIQSIVPWASNFYTEEIIRRVRAQFGAAFSGFWMLGGMAGGGMAFLFDAAHRADAHARLGPMMSALKRELEAAVPFAMEPVVYDFAINTNGSRAELLCGKAAVMAAPYYTFLVPDLIRSGSHALSPARRAEIQLFGWNSRSSPDVTAALIDRLLPRAEAGSNAAEDLQQLLANYGFDREMHEQIRADLRAGRIGVMQNRLPAETSIEDVKPGDVVDAAELAAEEYGAAGAEALRNGRVAVVTLAGGAGSRWTRGAGVMKALNPFWKIAGRHRNFLEVHLAKTRRTRRKYGAAIPHVITTSYLTHDPIERFAGAALDAEGDLGIWLSQGRSIGLRLVPTVRDLRFIWEETPQQVLDERQERMRQSVRSAIMRWAAARGASDYTDNVPSQCIHPVGHWYEISNMLRNGVLRELLRSSPGLRYLMVHNVDTMGADVHPLLLGYHIASGAAITTEVTPRHFEDRGGGLARVNQVVRLVEALALPTDEIESVLTWYNSNTAWIDIEQLLGAFGLSAGDLGDESRVSTAVRNLAMRMPTYITIKEVKKRWGKGQEDVYPVAQFEKLWGDMTALPEMNCRYVGVSRFRGQQLKEPAQLDGWARDGSADYVAALCDWE